MNFIATLLIAAAPLVMPEPPKGIEPFAMVNINCNVGSYTLLGYDTDPESELLTTFWYADRLDKILLVVGGPKDEVTFIYMLLPSKKVIQFDSAEEAEASIYHSPCDLYEAHITAETI